MLRAYLAISYDNRHQFKEMLTYLVEKIKEVGVELFVFVDHYNFQSNQEKEMMKTAFKEIDNSDFLIAELTYKSIGVGIEVGYAYATKKPILYLRKKGSAYSTTAAGSSDFIIEYDEKKKAVEKVINAISKLKENNKINLKK